MPLPRASDSTLLPRLENGDGDHNGETPFSLTESWLRGLNQATLANTGGVHSTQLIASCCWLGRLSCLPSFHCIPGTPRPLVLPLRRDGSDSRGDAGAATAGEGDRHTRCRPGERTLPGKGQREAGGNCVCQGRKPLGMRPVVSKKGWAALRRLWGQGHVQSHGPGRTPAAPPPRCP